MQLLHLTGSQNEHSQKSPHFLYFGCNPCLPHLATKIKIFGLKGMTCLDKLRQTYILAELNTKEAHSKQKHDKHDNIPQFEIGDLIMIKNLNKNGTGMQNMYPTFEW